MSESSVSKGEESTSDLEECSFEEIDSEDAGSSQEDIDSGKFFNRIEMERNKARHERKYMINVLKSKSRIGSIFFDKVKRVVAAI